MGAEVWPGAGNVIGPGSAVSGNLASFNGTSGQSLADSGIAAANVVVDADILRSYLATTITYNNVDVLANTALSVSVAAGGIYAIELVVHSTSAVVALKMDFGGTATITNFIGEWVGHVQVLGESFDGYAAGVTSAGTDFAPAGLLDGSSNFYSFTGSVEINAAGTFLLRGAQNVADASDTTILRGSTLQLTKYN